MNDLLKQLGLTTLLADVARVMETARQQQWSYETFLQAALTVELRGRAQRALERRLRGARLPLRARLETFDFRFQPSVSERLIGELASAAFVEQATNIVLLGPPGVGKTHLACGLAAKAVAAGYSAMFTTLRDLATALDEPPRPGQGTPLRRYLRPKVLVIDEVGYVRLTSAQAHGLFDLIAARYERSSVIVTSNLSFTEWGSLLGDDVLATALLDRLLHHAEIVPINGRSYRLRDRMTTDRAPATEVGQN